MSRVSVHIVTWNSERFIENALRSLDEQNFRDFSVLIVDNNSTDKTVQLLSESHPQLKVVRNSKNVGFAKAHNQAIHFTSSDYVLVMNPDTILTKNFLSVLVKLADENYRLGSASGKVLKLTGDPQLLSAANFTRTIDTIGLGMQRNRRAYDLGEGETDSPDIGQREIIGPSGALGFYRRRALEDVKYVREFFDEDFYAYKEDVDLAWRLQWRGWQSLSLPTAVAYHHRSAAGQAQLNNLETAGRRRSKAGYVNYLSYRNHLCLLVKNEQSFKRDWLFILWYELRKLVYILLFEQKTLKGLWQFFRLWPKMRIKRHFIQSQSKVTAAALRKIFQSIKT